MKILNKNALIFLNFLYFDRKLQIFNFKNWLYFKHTYGMGFGQKYISTLWGTGLEGPMN